MKYVTRAFNMEYMEFTKCKEEILKRGEKIAGISLSSREHIAKVGHSFVEDGCTVLVHGHSRVVTALLLKAAESKQFNILITEGRPKASDTTIAAQKFVDAGIPTTVISDNAVGHVMDRVDLCIVGAEGVMENGGIVNKVE
jgi:translation initiation factor eIF-2B subunit alpha